jgi:thiol-disulfide isomerase/thioredoxin
VDLFDVFSLGPFNVPIRFVIIGGFLAAAILAARIPLGRRRLLRSRITDRLINAVIVFIAAWKLTPAILDPAGLLRDPLPLVMGAPGPWGLAVGAAAAAAYLVVSLLRRRGLRRAAILPLVLFAAVTAAGVVGTELAASMAVVSHRTPGPEAPALDLPTLDDRGISLASLKGHVVVVNFWATWCPPCRAELPDLAAFARSQGSSGVVLVGVDAAYSEPSEQAVRAFARDRQVEYTVALDRTGDVTRSWGVKAWPTTVIVDAEGRIAARRTGAVDDGWLRREVRLTLPGK